MVVVILSRMVAYRVLWLRNGVRDCSLVQMSGGNWCLVRRLGLVKGGKGLRHHEVLVDFSAAALFGSLRRVFTRGSKSPAASYERGPAPLRSADPANIESLSSAA
jgi:hypothetical protein